MTPNIWKIQLGKKGKNTYKSSTLKDNRWFFEEHILVKLPSSQAGPVGFDIIHRPRSSLPLFAAKNQT